MVLINYVTFTRTVVIGLIDHMSYIFMMEGDTLVDDFH